MRNPTEMMRQILKSETAQTIIDYVTPIYGESYVALWMYEAIGQALQKVEGFCESLKNEGNPATSVLLLDYWENYYHIPRDTSLNIVQRQQRIVAKMRQRGPLNPTALENMVSAALGGVPVEITERYAKNTFLVNIREVVDSINPAVAVLEARKPAHLIYKIQVATQTVSDAEIKTAIAVTHAERFKVEVLQ